MNLMNKLISIIFLTLFFSAGTCFAQNDLLSRVPQLQKDAARGNGGGFGCGVGQITLVTSRGEIKTGAILDIVGVFGEKVVVADLLTLLEARTKYNLTGEQNPMSGNIILLASMTLSLLSQSKDPSAVPVIVKLLDDKDAAISGWSATALLWLAQSSEDLQKEIEKVAFPKAALKWAEGRNLKIPSWVKVKENS